MAGIYTSKDLRSLIDKHRENLKRLEASSALPARYTRRIQDCVNRMLSSGTFARIVMDELKGKTAADHRQLSELIRFLYLYKRATQQSNTCKQLLQGNRDRIQNAIKEASGGSNAISWFFSSSIKKQALEDACAILDEEINDGDYWASSQEVLSAIAENDGITAEDGWNDFNSHAAEYKRNLKQNLPDNYKLSESIGELKILVHKFTDSLAKLEKETEKTDSIKEDIQNAVKHMVMPAVLELLKTVPVEEVNRDKNGFRVKTLRDAGYATMADIYAAPSDQLAAVNGISEAASCALKKIANNFAGEAAQSAKIKLSADNKTYEATKLVTELFRYRQYSAALDALNQLNSDCGYQIQSAIADLNSVKNGVFWSFFDHSKKIKIKKSFEYLNSAIKGDYRSRVDEVVRLFKTSGGLSTSHAWDDFRVNPISYFNTLEKIVPGVLGNDDQLYGLPEDLAKEIQEESFFPDGLNCELRRYQEWGVKYILHQERVLLGDEMGLGKTVQAIAAMVSLRNTGASHFIVVCPASVLPNWCKEIASKSDLRVTKVHGTGRTSALEAWVKNGGVAVTTYETIGTVPLENGFNFDFLVVDEAHFIKNANAIRSKNVRQLAAFANRILFMTGTALENNVDEMISLIEILQPNVAKSIQSIAFMSTAPQFREKIAGVYYRRKREDVLTELPDLIESREWCTMSEEETALYEQEVMEKNFMGIRRLSWNVDSLDLSCKARRMMEIIEEAESEGRKVLIFSFFLDTIRKIYAYLGVRCCDPINGSLQPQRRQEIIDQFNDSPEKTVLCAQIQSGGTGFNIQAASVVIICEPQFKPSIENQAISRAYRMGQARNVLVYRLLCENTVDARITDLLEEKQAIFDAFADKSVAADKTADAEKEVDHATFGKIIEEEIQRIQAKSGTISDEPKPAGSKPAEPKDEMMFNDLGPQGEDTNDNSAKDDTEFTAKSALTTTGEYAAELEMDYNQLVQHLLQKYGKAKGDYFLTETCESKNERISRASEGLFCHHIDEAQVILLSNDRFAVNNPFAYQRAERLVYCNILEHLLLHVKIAEAHRTPDTDNGELTRIGGAVKFITEQINDYYNGYAFKQQHLITAMHYIEGHFDDYIKVLNRLLNTIQNDPLLSIRLSKEKLSARWDGTIVQQVYNRLS